MNLMLKMILCAVVVFGFSTVGFSYSKKLYHRKRVLEDFVLLLKSAVTKIRYSTQSLSFVFSDNFMSYEFIDDKPFVNQWTDMLKVYFNILDKTDIEILTEFAQSLGVTDVKGELSNINMYIEMLEHQVCDANENIIKKSKLYSTLGVSLGLAVTIMIV